MDMNNEELYLRDNFSPDKNPFTVPTGYFDTLADRIIDGLPKEETTIKTKTNRWWMYAAASVVLAVCSVTAYFHFNTQDENVVASAASTSFDSFDEAADYVMLDNQDIYACLTNDF
jgi:hypothetical protein